MLSRLPRRRHAAAVAMASLAGLPLLALAPAATARADVVRNTEQWVLSDLNIQPAWAATRGQGITVAVIDSGVDPNVSDLTGSVRTGPNFSGVNTPPGNPNWGTHGTWMASLIAGHGHDGGSGIIGTAPQSTVLSIRVITDTQDPNYGAYQRESATKGQDELAAAIRYAVGQHAQVISMSLGYNLPSEAVRAALQDAYQHNVVVVASAGNSGDAAYAAGDGHAAYSFPANYPGVLAVAAVNSSNQVATFSSQNLSVQVAAPGYKVPAQGRDGQYWYVSGTSPACALTAGVVALIKARYPRLTDPQVIAAITSSTTPSTRPRGGYDEQIGFGVVNAGAALTAAGKLSAAAPAAPGLSAASHFGGGPAAIPPAPVSSRGETGLALYCLLGLAGLAIVALATSKLLAPRGVPAGSTAPDGPADGAQPRGTPGAPGYLPAPPAEWPPEAGVSSAGLADGTPGDGVPGHDGLPAATPQHVSPADHRDDGGAAARHAVPHGQRHGHGQHEAGPS